VAARALDSNRKKENLNHDPQDGTQKGSGSSTTMKWAASPFFFA